MKIGESRKVFKKEGAEVWKKLPETVYAETHGYAAADYELLFKTVKGTEARLEAITYAITNNIHPKELAKRMQKNKVVLKKKMEKLR